MRDTDRELERLRSLLRKCLYTTEQPSKHELIRGIVFVLKEKLGKLSYEEVKQFSKEFKLLEEDC